MLGVGGLPAVAYFFLLFLVPESPRFLIKKGKITEARNVLQKIETRDIEAEILDIKSSMVQKKRELVFGPLQQTNIYCISCGYVQPVFRH